MVTHLHLDDTPGSWIDLPWGLVIDWGRRRREPRGEELARQAQHRSDYLTAAQTPDGKLVMAYMPSTRTVTVDMTKLAGPVTARWYDPSNGVYTPIRGSPFTNTGSRQFTPTGRNSDGDGDWVLVLEAR